MVAGFRWWRLAWLWGLALGVFAGGTAAAEPVPVQQIPAMGALQQGERLVVWAPDYRSVLGYSLQGERLWRLGTGDQGGTRALEAWGEEALVWAGREALVVSPARGEVLGRRALTREDCRLEQVGGSCLARCGCGFEIVDCRSLKPIVEERHASAPKYSPRGEPVADLCESMEVQGLGHDQGLHWVALKAWAWPSVVGVRELRAYGGRYGERRWSTPLHGPVRAFQRAGELCVFDDGAQIRALDCLTGRGRWAVRLHPGERMLAGTVGPILRQGAREATAFDPETGEVRWQHRGDGEVSLPGQRPRSWQRDRVQLLSLEGESLGSFSVPVSAQVRRLDDGGAFVFSPQRVALYEPSGREVAAWSTAGAWLGFRRAGSWLALWHARGAELSRLPARQSPREMKVRGEVVGLSDAGEVVLLSLPLARWSPDDPKTFGELVFYAF